MLDSTKVSLTSAACHETTARAARLERGVPVTLGWIEFSLPLDGPVSQCDAVSTVATLPLVKGLKGFIHVEA